MIHDDSYHADTMPAVPCSHPGCGYTTGDLDKDIVVELLKTHRLTHEPAAPQSTVDANRQKPPKLTRPSITKGISEEEWFTVSRKWEIFKNSTTIAQDELSTHLWQCCEEELTSEMF